MLYFVVIFSRQNMMHFVTIFNRKKYDAFTGGF